MAKRILKVGKEKQLDTYQGIPITVSADFKKQKPYRPEGSGIIYISKVFSPKLLKQSLFFFNLAMTF